MVERSDAAGAPPAQEAVPAGRRASADGAPPAARPEKPRPEGQSGGSQDSEPGGASSRRDESTSTPPWRVEGMPGSKRGRGAGRPDWRQFLWIMLALLILNWLLASWLVSAAARLTVSYSFF